MFSGVGKSDDEIRQALELDILMINVESAAELDRVEIIAKELNKVARISIRVNPNIDPKHIHIFLQGYMKINLV